MTRNENQMYSDITSIRKSLEKISNALDTPNVVYNGELKNTKDIPGFEGTLDALDNLYQPDLSVYGNKDEYETDGTSVGNGKYEDDVDEFSNSQKDIYETDLQGIRVDSDHDIRSTANYYDECLALDS